MPGIMNIPTINDAVLILVVMEEGQRPLNLNYDSSREQFGLNPCCNGRGSKTAKNIKC